MQSLTGKIGLLAAADLFLAVALARAVPAVTPQSSNVPLGLAASATKASNPFSAIELTATPASGPGPLAVTFRLRTGRLPATMPYTINFGDGSSGTLHRNMMPNYLCAPVSPNCVNPTPTFSTSHTYASPGTYRATVGNPSSATLAAATIKVTAAKP